MARTFSALLLAAAAAIAVPTAADPAADPVVATVGAVKLHVSDVERRLDKLPPFQRTALGATPAEIRRRALETLLIPEALYSQAAESQMLATAPWMRARIQGAYRRMLHEALEQEIRTKSPITDAEVRAYYDEHRDQFVRGERIQIWRIVVKDEALAKRIIAEARGTDGPERWKALAREHSIDAATKMRGGALGFVYADGHTDVPQVRVAPALFDAAKRVKDGEVVAEPIEEGDRFSVIWRRGSIPAVERAIEQERPAIEQVLMRQRVKKRFDDLIERLTKEHVREIHPELLDAIPTPEPAAGRGVATHGPGRSAKSAASSDPVPRPGPGGNR